MRREDREVTGFAEIVRILADAVGLVGDGRASFLGVSSALQGFAKPFREFTKFEDQAVRLAPLVGDLETSKKLARELRDEAANGTMSFEQLTNIAGRRHR